MDIERQLTGLVNLPEPSPEERPQLVSMVCAEIAQGADITDACASAGVLPAHYLAWTVDDEQTATAHARALKIRARLLADAPIAARRVIAAAREGATGAHRLGEVVAAAKAEAELAALLAERGEPAPAKRAESHHSVRISFDPLPTHAIGGSTDAVSDAIAPSASDVTRALPATYTIVDELDG